MIGLPLPSRTPGPDLLVLGQLVLVVGYQPCKSVKPLGSLTEAAPSVEAQEGASVGHGAEFIEPGLEL